MFLSNKCKKKKKLCGEPPKLNGHGIYRKGGSPEINHPQKRFQLKKITYAIYSLFE